MLNPIDIEQRFRDLLFTLSYPAPGLFRLNALNEFLDCLGEDVASFESYALDALEHIPALVRSLPREGYAPDPLQQLEENLRMVTSRVPAASELSGLGEARAHLRQIIAGLYAYAGSIDEALTVLGTTDAVDAPAENAPDELPAGRFARLQDAVRHAQEKNDPAAAGLDALVRIWSSQLHAGADTAIVPVIHHALAAGSPADSGTGMLRRLRLTIASEKQEPADELTSDAAVYGAEQTADAGFATALQAARALFRETNPRLLRKHFAAHLSFSPHEGLHEGGSANLAIAALFYCAVLRFTNQRTRYLIRPRAAITGGVNAQGSVTAIDNGTLGLKVEAAFFSHVDTLIVPRQHVQQAEQAAADLTRRYPGRRLDILGIIHVRELFYDLRVIDQQRSGALLHFSRQLWRNRLPVGGVALVLLLALIIARLVIGPLDRNPTALEFRNESLFLKNESGEVIEKEWVGAGVATGFTKTLKLHDDVRWALLDDVDRDGKNEVIFAVSSSADGGRADRICCKRVGSDSLLWTLSTRFNIRFPNSPDVTEDLYVLRNLALIPSGPEGEQSLFIIASHMFFPCLMLEVDPRTGKERSRYLHTGTIATSLAYFDIDGDGMREIVVGAINNGFRKNAVIAFNPRYIRGHSPATERYMPEGWEPGTEKYYVVLPTTMVNRVLAPRSYCGGLLRVQANDHDSTLMILVDEANFATDSSGNLIGASIAFYFNTALRLRSISTSSPFDLIAERLYAEGKISRLPDFTYLKQLMQDVSYWNGDSLQREPVINKYYLQAKGTAAP